MKLIGIALAAATLLGSVAVSTPAMAQSRVERHVERHTTVIHRDRKRWGNHHRNCRTVWRNHHRVTRCR